MLLSMYLFPYLVAVCRTNGEFPDVWTGVMLEYFSDIRPPTSIFISGPDMNWDVSSDISVTFLFTFFCNVIEFSPYRVVSVYLPATGLNVESAFFGQILIEDEGFRRDIWWYGGIYI